MDNNMTAQMIITENKCEELQRQLNELQNSYDNLQEDYDRAFLMSKLLYRVSLTGFGLLFAGIIAYYYMYVA